MMMLLLRDGAVGGARNDGRLSTRPRSFWEKGIFTPLPGLCERMPVDFKNSKQLVAPPNLIAARVFARQAGWNPVNHSNTR
jgi:hypothetical protein